MTTLRWFAIFLAAMTPVLPAGPASLVQAHASEGSRTAATETYVVRKINDIRAEHGLAPLNVSGKLRTAARRQSSDMAANNFLSHVDSKGNNLEVRIARVGATGWSTIGENVGQSMGYRNNSDVIIEGWMNSPNHRDNILSGSFDSTGIGAAVASDGTLYLTQVFMGAGKSSDKTAGSLYKKHRRTSARQAAN